MSPTFLCWENGRMKVPSTEVGVCGRRRFLEKKNPHFGYVNYEVIIS